MYETFFGLTRRPFAAAPQVEQYVPNPAAEHALQTLARAIERAEGPGLLIGATGTGKTFLLQMLAERYQAKYRVAQLATARFSSPRALLQNILYELGRPYRGMEEAELRLALTDHLTELAADGQPLLLLVDEAHTLSLRLLEEIRTVTNLVREGESLVRLVLAGTARLEERFTSPKLDSLNQRIAARCYLESLNRDDAASYVRRHLTAAGGNPDQLLADDAYGAIYTASDGVPRLINQVCDQALILAAVARQRLLDAACVEEAWADLQQLPTPWHREAQSRQSAPGAPAEVVEFGSLAGDAPTASGPATPSATGADRRQSPRSEKTAARATEFDVPTGREMFSYDTGAAGDPTIEIEHLQHSLSALQSDVAESLVTQPLPATGSAGSFDEEEFQPAGFVGPEVELVFHGPHHPFGETFVEEEVVIDHYASLEKSVAERRVHDASGEGQRIAAILSQRGPDEEPEASSPRPNLGVVAAGIEGDSHPGHDAAVGQPNGGLHDDLAALTSPWEAAAAQPVMPDYPHDSELVASAARREPTERRTESELEPSLDLTAATDDRDIIIIEEQRAEAAAAVAEKTRGRVRRQEYRQLFARLRRGG